MLETALHIYMVACTVIVTLVLLLLGFVHLAFRDEFREQREQERDYVRRHGI